MRCFKPSNSGRIRHISSIKNESELEKQYTITGVCSRFRYAMLDNEPHSEEEWKKKKGYIWTASEDKQFSLPYFLSLIMQEPGYLAFLIALIPITGALFQLVLESPQASSYFEKIPIIANFITYVIQFDKSHNSFVATLAFFLF